MDNLVFLRLTPKPKGSREPRSIPNKYADSSHPKGYRHNRRMIEVNLPEEVAGPTSLPRGIAPKLMVAPEAHETPFANHTTAGIHWQMPQDIREESFAEIFLLNKHHVD